MEFVEVDELLVDVLAVITSAAIVEEEVDLFVDRPENFGCELLVRGDLILVLDAFLFDLLDEGSKLARKDARFTEDVLARVRVRFDLEGEGVVVLGDRDGHLSQCLDVVEVPS